MQNSAFKMIIFLNYANLELTFYLKKGFLGEFCIKVDIFIDGSITAQWAKIGPWILFLVGADPLAENQL